MYKYSTHPVNCYLLLTCYQSKELIHDDFLWSLLMLPSFLPPVLLSCTKALSHYTAVVYYAFFSSFQLWVFQLPWFLTTLIASGTLANWTFHWLFLKRELFNFYLMIKLSYLWRGHKGYRPIPSHPHSILMHHHRWCHPWSLGQGNVCQTFAF